MCPPSSLRGLVMLLCGMAAIGGAFGHPTSAHAIPSLHGQQSTERVQSTPPGTQDASDQPSPEQSPEPAQASPEKTVEAGSEPEESFVENMIEVLFLIFLLGPIIAIVSGLLLAFPAVLLGVFLVMDGGCLRYILFGIGWLFSLICGLMTGALIGQGLFGVEFLIKPFFYTFMLGYPAAGYWAHSKLQSMPEERYRAWEQTLTGGALLGFGAGSIAGLLRSAASGFGGFGGGSFGGGGASGSWSGTSAATSTSSAAGSVSSSATAATSTGTAGSASQPAAVAAGATPGAAGASSSEAPTSTSSQKGFWTRLGQWFQKFQWYHGLVFVLATIVFLPLGLGTIQALQNTKFFVFALVSVVLYSGYKLLRRNPNVTQSVVRSISSWRGGEASSSWS